MSALEQVIQSRIEAALGNMDLTKIIDKVVANLLGGSGGSGKTTSVKKVATSTGAKRGPKPKTANKDEVPSAGRAGSLKDRIINILNQNPDGLVMKDIFQKVQDLVDRGEYETKSKNLGNIIGQAMHTLKKEKLVKKDEDKKYVSLYHPSEETEEVSAEETAEVSDEAEVETATA